MQTLVTEDSASGPVIVIWQSSLAWPRTQASHHARYGQCVRSCSSISRWLGLFGALAARGACASTSSSGSVRLASTISPWTSWDSTASSPELSVAFSEPPASSPTGTSMPSTFSTSSACGLYTLSLGLTGSFCKFILACENLGCCCRRQCPQTRRVPIHFLFSCTS